MEQYREFTYYSYMHYENALNVGWEKTETIDNNEEFDSDFLENLWMYIKQPFNKIRSLPLKEVTFNNETRKVGMSEIRVIANVNGKNVRYAALDSIIIDILNQNYIPPKEFVIAVIGGVKPKSDEYEMFTKRYSPKYMWGEDDDYVEYAIKLLHLIKNKDLKGFVHVLEEREDSLNIITEEGSILNSSILANATDISFELLERGFDFNKLNSIELNYAIKMGENEIVKYLLSNSVILNLSDPKFNPYFTAISNNNVEVVKLLLDNDIDKSIKYSTPFMWEEDALKYALECEKKEIADLLV